MDRHLHEISAHPVVKDSVILEVTSLVELVNSLVNIVTPLGVVDGFYQGLGVRYYKIVSLEVERRVSSLTDLALYLIFNRIDRSGLIKFMYLLCINLF